MKKKKTAILALAVAATMTCGMLAGCSLITTDVNKDYMQVVATVDITQGADFEEGGKFAQYKEVVAPASIIKRDMIAMFVSSGSSAMNSYNWTFRDTFKAISESLVNRQITIQYAMVYLLANGKDADGKNVYTFEEFKTAIAGKTGEERELAALEYFLGGKEGEEVQRALYSTRKLFNNTLDSQENTYIKAEDDEDETAVTVRTLPKGVNTTNGDYYNPGYKVYTAVGDADKGGHASSCEGYETVEGSTPSTRKKAYNSFLANLRRNDLLSKGEDTSYIENLNYFKIELKSAYESALVSKLGDLYEEEAEKIISDSSRPDSPEKYYRKLFNDQEAEFNKDAKTFEDALDNVSDTNFLLTAPKTEGNKKYGYVINILLPFSTSQKARVDALNADYGDTKGNSFKQRAQILKEIKATDQRETWFTGETDYSFDTSKEGNAVANIYTGGDSNRKYLFFQDCLNVGDNAEYEPLKNYYGNYSYNGQVREKDGKYEFLPKEIDIDGFLAEMKDYLTASTGLNVTESKTANYYTQDYYTDGSVDYSKFVYSQGQVQFTEPFDASRIFVRNSIENKTFSVMNELSFAYNTDTAGLNPYYGYSVVTGKTSFVSEFEYAAQLACENGAGYYVVAPSTYGWHVIYCTFSFEAKNVGNDETVIEPFVYNPSDVENEGSFSNLFYEARKSTVAQQYSSNMQAIVLSDYIGCATVYEDRYSDLFELDA